MSSNLPLSRLLPILLAATALASAPAEGRAAQQEAGGSAVVSSADDGKSTVVKRKVDVNLAEVAELQVLPQVGPVVAQRIVDYRRAVGPFRKVEELLNVKGIGGKTLERLRPLITLGSPPAETAAAPSAAPSEGKG